MNFANNSIALVKDNKILFSLDRSGIRPIYECVKQFKDKEKECILYDKVVGLAAARLIVYSGIISEVVADVCSKPAKEFLEENNITLKYRQLVDNILNNDRNDVCPMETKAKELDNHDLYLHLKGIFEI